MAAMICATSHRTMRLPCLLLLAGPLTGTSLAQTVEVETFTVPKAITAVTPDYPPNQVIEGGEGVVQIRFMVDTEGQSFDAVIVDSTGSERFHASALKALEDWEFEPAMLNGEPIVGSSSARFVFVLEEQSAASGNFRRAYRIFQRALSEGEKEEIDDAMTQLEERGALNHYENSFLSLARYSYALLFGTEIEQIRHLSHALSLSEEAYDEVFLDEELTRDLRRALFPLQVSRNFFAEALDTYELLEASGDAEAAANFASAVEAIRELREDDTEYLIPMTLSATGSANLNLFKRNFALTGGDGNLVETILRCERGYFGFSVERDVSYNVPAASGDCSIEIVGDAGATFFLAQH